MAWPDLKLPTLLPEQGKGQNLADLPSQKVPAVTFRGSQGLQPWPYLPRA